MNSFDRRFLQTLPFIKMSLMNDNMNNNDTLQGTGANCLVTGIYLTFLFSFVIMVVTTAHFLIGASVEKVSFSRWIPKILASYIRIGKKSTDLDEKGKISPKNCK